MSGFIHVASKSAPSKFISERWLVKLWNFLCY